MFKNIFKFCSSTRTFIGSIYFGFVAIICVIMLFPVNAEDDRKITQRFIDEIFSYQKQDVQKALNDLVSLRFYKHLSASKVDALKDAWARTKVGDYEWNPEIIENVGVRVLLAEILWKFNGQSNHEYYAYIASKTRDESADIRGIAALSLGFVGSNNDIEVLVDMLKNDEVFPAIQAAFGLIALGSDSAMKKLEESLTVLTESGKQDNVQKARVIEATLESMKLPRRME